MGFAKRRRADLGQPARSPGGSPGSRGAGATASAASPGRAWRPRSRSCRATRDRSPDEDRAQVEVETGNFHVPDYDRDDLDELIEEAAAAHGISAHLVRAVVEAESGFDPWSVSPAGAQGLMQLMPATARLMGVNDRLDPRQNVFGGTKYLSQILDRFDGNVALALAGYNAGPAKVARYRGIPPYPETRGYVIRIRGLLAETTGALFPLPKPALAPGVRTAAGRRAWAARLRRRVAALALGPWPSNLTAPRCT